MHQKNQCALRTGYCAIVTLETNVLLISFMKEREKLALELQERLTRFSTRIVTLSEALPQTRAAKHVANQVLRSGTAPMANYAEARNSESRSDFIHKLRIVLKELNETEAWLDLIQKNSWFSPTKMSRILAENRELCRIIAKSIQTAGGFNH